MIETFAAENYKCLRDYEARLGKLTLLLGPNASGKSTVLQALLALCRAGVDISLPGDLRELQTHGASEHKLESSKVAFGGNRPIRLRLAGEWRGKKGRLELACEPAGPEAKGWLGKIAGSWDGKPFDIDERTPRELRSDDAEELRQILGRVAYLRFDARNLAAPWPIGQDLPRIGDDGRYLASVLVDLQLNQPRQFSEIQEALRSVIPIVKGIRFEKVSVVSEQVEIVDDDEGQPRGVRRNVAGYRILFDMKAADSVPAHAAGEGTLLVLGLLTVLMGKGRPNILLVDDLDRGLHPSAMKTMVDAVKSLLSSDADMQLLATAHSPYFVDCLDASEVRLLALGDDGGTRCRALTEHPDYERHKAVLSTGELWSTFGEEWVKAAPGR